MQIYQTRNSRFRFVVSVGLVFTFGWIFDYHSARSASNIFHKKILKELSFDSFNAARFFVNPVSEGIFTGSPSADKAQALSCNCNAT